MDVLKKCHNLDLLCVKPCTEEIWRGKEKGLGFCMVLGIAHDDLDCYSLESRRQMIIGLVTGSAVFSGIIIMLGVRYRDKLAGLLKTKWGSGRKEPQYQKTSAEEESTILQAGQQSLKMTPVTEL
ncbi:hypothetical protein HNY73_010478 [Argiope bruennichi]|uniref:Uncharacterized protein n=1 Tax=Argiope bruennichi TaxID=94029 RepID=A0A8T0F167_ARGBR|nr:hypothetical protein HNY73_010478 [Argiope bruennichi]